ncbi:hypothetical protein HDU97_006096 [Phlyctochytrium planicorne]|nr:hypothetical protein HDU97_006096 [Phlyctochytrium planicorne]
MIAPDTPNATKIVFKSTLEILPEAPGSESPPPASHPQQNQHQSDTYLSQPSLDEFIHQNSTHTPLDSKNSVRPRANSFATGTNSNMFTSNNKSYMTAGSHLTLTTGATLKRHSRIHTKKVVREKVDSVLQYMAEQDETARADEALSDYCALCLVCIVVIFMNDRLGMSFAFVGDGFGTNNLLGFSMLFAAFWVASVVLELLTLFLERLFGLPYYGLPGEDFYLITGNSCQFICLSLCFAIGLYMPFV